MGHDAVERYFSETEQESFELEGGGFEPEREQEREQEKGREETEEEVYDEHARLVAGRVERDDGRHRRHEEPIQALCAR